MYQIMLVDSIICNVEMENSLLTLCNVYALNNDDPTFSVNLFKMLSKHAMDNVIIGGDFNLVMDPDIFRNKSKTNNTKAYDIVKTFMSENQMIDIWRNNNPIDRRYTWFKREYSSNMLPSASRIDMFLVNVGLVAKTAQTNIHIGCRTDHALIELEIIDEINKRGPGIWKFNNVLLTNENFCNQMKEVIAASLETSANSGLDAMETWLYVKSECARFTRGFTRNKTKEQNLLLNNLYRLKSTILNDRFNVPQAQNITDDTLRETNQKIVDIENDQARSAIFRARCHWSRLGEKPTKYFYSLEK